MKVTPEARRTGPHHAELDITISGLDAIEATALYRAAIQHGLTDLAEAISDGIDMALAAAEPVL